jgi:hypothetical protein
LEGVADAFCYAVLAGPTGEDEGLKSKLYLATEEGDFLSADWRAKQNKEAGPSNAHRARNTAAA